MAHPQLPAVLSILDRIIAVLPDRFVRRRKLGPWQVLMLHLLSLMDGNRPRLEVLLQRFAEHFTSHLWYASAPRPSSLSRARAKLSGETIRACFADAVAAATAAQAKSRSWDPRWRLIGVDGTRVTLRRTAELSAAFHHPRPRSTTQTHYPQMLLVTAWDVVARIPVTWTTVACDGNERDGVTHALPMLNQRDVLVCDRNFPSARLFELIGTSVKFIMRMHAQGSAWGAVKGFLAAGRTDGEVDQPVPSGGTTRFRLVAYPSVTGKPIVLATNLTPEEMSAERVAYAYQLRWSIETAFREFKGGYGLERLTGDRCNVIEQEIAALMLFQLAVGEMTAVADAQIQQEDRESGDTGEIRSASRTLAGEVCRQIFLNFAAGKTQTEILGSYERGLDSLLRSRFRKRPGRHFPRTSHSTYSKWGNRGRAEG